jgi:hypothetical protein
VVTALGTSNGNVNAGEHSARSLGGSVEGSRRKREERCTRRHTGCTEELCFLCTQSARTGGRLDIKTQATNGAKD